MWSPAGLQVRGALAGRCMRRGFHRAGASRPAGGPGRLPPLGDGAERLAEAADGGARSRGRLPGRRRRAGTCGAGLRHRARRPLQQLLSAADARVALPMTAGVSSLNLATAVSAVLFVLRERGAGERLAQLPEGRAWGRSGRPRGGRSRQRRATAAPRSGTGRRRRRGSWASPGSAPRDRLGLGRDLTQNDHLLTTTQRRPAGRASASGYEGHPSPSREDLPPLGSSSRRASSPGCATGRPASTSCERRPQPLGALRRVAEVGVGRAAVREPGRRRRRRHPAWSSRRTRARPAATRRAGRASANSPAPRRAPASPPASHADSASASLRLIWSTRTPRSA